MILYPAFAAAIAELDVDDLALRSGVASHSITAVADGLVEASDGMKMKLARALDADVRTLFALDPHLEAHRVATEARGLRWQVTDPATLRLVDRRPA